MAAKNPDSPSNRQTFLTGNPPSSLIVKYHKISPCFERQGNGFPLTWAEVSWKSPQDLICRLRDMKLLALYQGVNPLGLFLWLCFDLFQNGSRNDYLIIELGEEVESSNLCQQYRGAGIANDPQEAFSARARACWISCSSSSNE